MQFIDKIIDIENNLENEMVIDDPDFINIEDLQELINIKCVELGINEVKIYNTECPVCITNIKNNDWILLHPCAHILCKACSPLILPILNSVRIPCPICRMKCKWIGNNNNNLRQISCINPIMDIYDDYIPAPNMLMRQTSIGCPNVNYQRNDNVSEEIINSKPPLNISIFGNQNNIINSEFSCILYEEKIIGSLTISANNLENQCNGKDYIFLIDNSGSMQSTINIIKENLLNLISNLKPIDRLSIIFFDNYAKQLFALQPMTATIKDQVCDIVQNEDLGGSTNYQSAFLLLKKVMVEGFITNRPIIIIFGSDGIPDIAKTGIQEIEDLYNTDIPFQIYSCSFGGDVSANVLLSVLKNNNQENYRHFEEINQFHYFIKNVLECDNSNIIAKDIKIMFKNIKPLSSQIICNGNNTYLINIDILKSIDFVSFPIEFQVLDNSEIHILYKNINNEDCVLNCERTLMDEALTIYTYNNKKIINIINDLNENTLLTKNEKIIELNIIKNSINDEKYGIFKTDIVNFLDKSIEYLSIPSLNYNNYNNIRQISATMSSLRRYSSISETELYDDI
jgi:hypothetical protein